ncbi:MAG: hypothetical protein NTW95_12105 [Candidatus Aminicenantes bacterium]|nr:hypothetical protein [Candidatus Aminicenantes bacterium]
MTNEHLRDEQIQEILDHMVLQPGQILPPHLRACPSCRERFAQYRRLYAGLAVDPGFALPPAFADSVLKKFPSSRPVFWQRPAMRIFLAASASALVLTGLVLFVPMKPLAAATARIFNSFAAAFRPLPAQFRQLLASLNADAGLFILGGLGLLGAAVFDHILQQRVLRRSR